jgi:hypothetical protein
VDLHREEKNRHEPSPKKQVHGESHQGCHQHKKYLWRENTWQHKSNKEFFWQENACTSVQVWETFWDKVLIPTNNMDLFIYMTEKSPFLQVIHSIAKFFDCRAGQDLNNAIIGFIGDRNQYCDPHPMILLVHNSWAWTAVTASLNEIEAEFFYVAAQDKKVCWVLPQEYQKQPIALPKMLFLPSLLGPFILEQRHTPWEF